MKILFFDGYCSLCNNLVDWLISRDKKNVLKFASLQGETAKTHLPSAYRKDSGVDTVVYSREGKLYKRSAAILHVLNDLGGLWSLMMIFMIIPGFLRDAVYRLVAKYRYMMFGKRETCRIPTSEEKNKLLP